VASDRVYGPTYSGSWALVVGVNKYRSAPPLSHATGDAIAFALTLESRFAFPKERITLLLDEGATQQGIRSAFLKYAGDGSVDDDRIAVFFAGHGFTRSGRRGEIGYLVPFDGDPKDLASLIRWDDLTRNAELIPAKHILFIMDACYGGLAVTRSLPPGSTRYLKDMLQRYSRQVLTAGKADEVVADAGGPRPGHSMFTGHLLDALDGGAASTDGVISANAVMAYVGERVAKDAYSKQSPHFGFIDGDGDFIFSALSSAELDPGDGTDNDVLLQMPSGVGPVEPGSPEDHLADRVKEYLSSASHRIHLNDLVSAEIRLALELTAEREFPLDAELASIDDFASRLRKYETALSRLRTVTVLLAHWGTAEHQGMLERIVTGVGDAIEPKGGKVLWLGLRWYPLELLVYSGGISALAARNHPSLSTLLLTRIPDAAGGHEQQEAILSITDGISEANPFEMFRKLPGHERQYTPLSEYLFKALQPEVEDLLFLGKRYEEFFDRFEVLAALTYAEIHQSASGTASGPIGRFGWKTRRFTGGGPYEVMISEAKAVGQGWGPITAGLFKGSIGRFLEIADSYREQVLRRLTWV
jgi:hypothetical protein